MTVLCCGGFFMDKKIIELYENKNQLLNASIDKITVELLKKKEDSSQGQTIVLTGCSPLAGTTSVSISLAIAMAATGRRTALVDCDLRKAVKYKKLNDDANVGLANYISSQNEFANNPSDITYETNIDNLFYIPCGDSEENSTRILCSEKMNGLLDQLKASYDCVILDFPSISVVPDAQVMFGKADGIILIAALGETKKVHIKDARRLIAPFEQSYYGMIINKAPMDIYKANVKNYDYYLLDKRGKQKFEKTKAYMLRAGKKGGTLKK